MALSRKSNVEERPRRVYCDYRRKRARVVSDSGIVLLDERIDANSARLGELIAISKACELVPRNGEVLTDSLRWVRFFCEGSRQRLTEAELRYAEVIAEAILLKGVSLKWVPREENLAGQD